MSTSLENHSPPCPNDLWKDLRQQMTPPAKKTMLLWLGIAASLLLLIGFSWVLTGLLKSPDVRLTSLSYDVSGDREKIQDALHSRGFHLKLLPPVPGAHHEVELMGLVFEEERARLYYECCDEPVLVVVGRQGQDVVASLDPDPGTVAFTIRKQIDQLELSAFSHHQPNEVLALIQ